MSNYIVSDTSLTSIANAIRTKGGTSEPLEFPDGFVTAIGEISGGGGRVSVPSKDVDFIDYDGTILYSYTKNEFLALEEMPGNPDRTEEELTAQGWNWTLAGAKTQVEISGMLTIGQLYTTTDGKTHIHINLQKGRTSPILGCCPNGTVDVDWGDGTSHSTLTGTNASAVKWTSAHRYSAPGHYVIKLGVTGSAGIYGSASSNQYSIILRQSTSGDTRNLSYLDAIEAMHLGRNFELGSYSFYYCRGLKYITIPNGCARIANNVFNGCHKLQCITLPYISTYGTYLFQYCYAMNRYSLPERMNAIPQYMFSSVYALERIEIPYTVKTIGASAFNTVQYATEITVPSEVTSINASAFQSTYGARIIQMLPETPPTLANTIVFGTLASDCIIYVPYSEDHSVLNAYKTATNWSTYASKMQEEPQ